MEDGECATLFRMASQTRTKTSPRARPRGRTYVFRVVVEPDGKAWCAYCPALEKWGAATWGRTQTEALRHIHEVVQMVVQELREDGISIPDKPEHEVRISLEPRVAVTVAHGD